MARRLPVGALVLSILFTSGCAYIGAGALLFAGGSSGGGGKAKPAVPAVFLDPIQRQVGDVTVDYSLQDGDTDPADIAVDYSTDGGSTYSPATEAATGSDGTFALTTSAAGVNHVYVWDSVTDNITGAFTQARIRITPSDPDGTGQTVESEVFTVGNDAPTVTVQDPTGDSGLIPITYTLFDSTQDLCSIQPAFSTDGGTTWAGATVTVGGTANLASDVSPTGTVHSFAWNTISDLGTTFQDQVVVRITPSDDFDTGPDDQTSIFTVLNNDSPAAFINPIARQDGTVQIDFLLLDPDSATGNVSLELSIDGGAIYGPITLTAGSVTTGLSASPGGDLHSVTWDSVTDIGAGALDTARVRLQPDDGSTTGSWAESKIFSVGNDVPVITVTPITGSHDEGVIRVEFTLEDTTADPVDLEVRYSTDSWATDFPATITVGVTQDVPSDPAGLSHAIAWNTRTDLPNQSVNVDLRITPSDDATGTIETGTPGFTGQFGVNNFDRPVAFIASPIEDQVVGGDVVISYLLFDTGSANLDIAMEYSADGVTYLPADECTTCVSPASDGVLGLASSPGGTSHIFVWDTTTVAYPQTDDQTVWLRLTPSDISGPGLEFTMQNPFLVNNNQQPWVFVGTPPSPQEGGDVSITYELGDTESDAVDITVTYSTDGGATFATATDAVTGSDGTVGLTAGDPPVLHTFIWDSITDVVAMDLKEDDVIVRIVPDDNPVDVRLGEGTTGQTAQFSVDNTDPPVVNNLANAGTTGTISVTYDLYDAEPSPSVDLMIDYSFDGLSYFPATIANPQPEGTVAGNIITGQIPASVAPGNPKSFDWDTATDIGPTDIIGVILRVACRDTKNGVVVGILVDVANNTAPTGTIQTPGEIPRGDIFITYTLSDTHSDPADITAEFSTDNLNFFSATERPGVPSEGITNLATDPGGLGHLFVWDSVTDLGLNAYAQVWFRITPRDTALGTPVTTTDFPVNNDELLPVARLDPVARSLTDDVTINYYISDGDSDPATIVVVWQQLPIAWTTATEGTGSDGTTGLTTSSSGEPHVFVWDSAADLPGGAQANLEIRIIPQDNDGGGTGDTSNLFIRGNDAPSATITNPVGGTLSGLIEVAFDLADSTSDPVDLAAAYSTDGGATWPAATITVGGTTSLATDPAGISHNFAWNSLGDLGIANLTGVMFRITPTDSFGAPGAADSVTFDVSNNDLPIVFIGSPSANDVRDQDVRVDYILIDGNSDAIFVDVDYSVDGGNSYSGASLNNTDAGTISGNRITGLPSSPGGSAHSFDWLSGTDFLDQDTDKARIRITPNDGQNAGLPFETPDFLVNNNLEPQVVSTVPFSSGDQTGPVTVNYTLADVESDNVTIAVLYSTDGGSVFAPATLSKCAGGDPGTVSGNEISGLPALPPLSGGSKHCFVWESGTDIPGVRDTDVLLHIAPRDNAIGILGDGAPGLTSIFVVDNTDAPSVSNLINSTSTGVIPMTYWLIDTESNTCDLTVTLSTDGGTSWDPATIAGTDEGAITGNVISGLSSGPGLGTFHTFDWDSNTDIGRTDLNGVLIRTVPADTKVGASTDDTIDLRNNDAPGVILFDIVGIQTGSVNIVYQLEDSFSDPLDISVGYRTGGIGPFTPATEVVGPPSDGTSGLASGPTGQEVAHVFVWDTLADLSTTVYTLDVEIQITATDPFLLIGSATTNAFSLDNAIRAGLVLGHDTFLQGGVDGRGVDPGNGAGFFYDGTQLFVTDFINNRVLILDSLPASNFQTADIVLGQPSFVVNTDNNGGRSARSFYAPSAVWSDGTRLYVCDRFNSRVLIWSTIPTASFQAADHVLGQANFTAGGSLTLRNRLNQPHGIFGDANHLYVADTWNHRIMIWNMPVVDWTDGQDADYVLGQLDFTSGDSNQGAGANNADADTLYAPYDLFTDGFVLYVADTENSRVLQWDIPGTWNNTRPADRVLGQPDFTTESATLGTNRMNRPRGVNADGSYVYVADRMNHRVMIWNSLAPATNSSATWFLGQPDGTSNTQNSPSGDPSDSSLLFPAQVFSDGSILLVYDEGNDRVKIHDPAPAANNAPAQAVFGQEDFTGGHENHVKVTAHTFRIPSGLDASGNSLFVVDRANNRVLGWAARPSVNNKNADAVFGQANFEDSGIGISATEFNRPADVAYDPVGDRLFVADEFAHRVLVFDGPISVDQTGDVFIGQPNATTGAQGTSINDFRWPRGVSWDGTYLWVADSGNHRVVRFTPPFFNDMPADLVVGQVDFDTGTANHSGSGDPIGDRSLNGPWSVCSTGMELLVGDRGNNRIMIWNTIPAVDDAPATVVIGQTDFSLPASGWYDRDSLNLPTGVASDGQVICVTDGTNQRVMVWDSIPIAGNHGLPADRLIGQPDYSSRVRNYEGVTERSLFVLRGFGAEESCMSGSVIVDGGTTYLWQPDCRNNRVLRYDVTP